ncbi:class C beta-lactamase [Paraburkholderia susongensis]|uniref:Beta-lactamase n=1 Tax=Paraburkholderia susongensis TaxID=1515439 RepID=A0A1X7LSH6_9BURK|nr:class C beta-lactamase [Paraburkholderia susongensis]SMG56434.1 beta-lactamase class C [Paraburkholderia susongensis]
MKPKALRLITTAAFAMFTLCALSPASHAANQTANAAPAQIKSTVDAAIQPLMAKYHIAGMAVGVIVAGKPYVFNYGVASTQTGKPVTRDTLFELGSVSKTFTATLASYAQLDGKLSLSDSTDQYLPTLRGSPFGKVSLLNLGTHTPGGLPLQVPDEIHNDAQLLQYFKDWQPAHAPGTYRTYSNPSIGTLGMITAKSMGQDFTALIEQRMFPALGMKNSYINVPATKMPDYAQGYTRDGAPIRLAGGVLSAEAYGVKSTAADVLRFVQANMNMIAIDDKLQHAITATHTGYFQASVLTQDLIWEQYPYPVALKTLRAGNSSEIALNATPATEIKPPLPPQQDVWINKTGSTNGFGSYVAFVPQQRVGIVILGNRNFPIEARVSAAYRILTTLSAASSMSLAK